MVDVSSQNNSVSINVSTGGNSASINAKPDTAQYYSEKSREWAVSNRIVDNTDYSSKYYAEQSKESEEKAENYERSVIEKYNSFIDISNQATSEIIEEKTNAIEQIDTKKSESIAEINNETNSSISAINLSKENAKTEISNSKDSAINQINNTGINTRANLDLSNLSAVGEKHFLNKSQITNCLLEVPQTINLEIINGELILKKGSKVIIANDYYTVPSDTKVALASTSGQKMLIYEKTRNLLMVYPVSSCASGDTLPSSGGIFFLTTDKCVYRYVNSAWIKTAGYALPLGIVTQSATELTSIDQVFNGFGFIGNIMFAHKGIKGLIPNGRNADGTLNNIEFVTSEVLVHNDTTGHDRQNHDLVLTAATLGIRSLSSYLENENYNYNGVTKAIEKNCVVGKFSKTPTQVTMLKPKLPFRAVDYNDFETKVSKTGDTMTGNLNFNMTSPQIMLIDSNKDNTITPTSADDVYGKIQFRDKNNVWLGGVECKNKTNGNLELQLFANRSIGDTKKTAAAYLSVDNTGKAFFTFPRCTTKPTTTSTASSSLVAVVTQNYLNGQSWYRVWSDGFCEQGGVWNYTHNAKYMATTITLLKALKTVLYKGATSIDHSSISTVIANCDFTTTSDNATFTHVSLSAERLYTTTTSSAGKVYWEVKGFIN